VIKTAAEKFLKYKDRGTETERMWNLKTEMVPVKVRTTGAISK
jgi:hypothetical protein